MTDCCIVKQGTSSLHAWLSSPDNKEGYTCLWGPRGRMDATQGTCRRHDWETRSRGPRNRAMPSPPSWIEYPVSIFWMLFFSLTNFNNHQQQHTSTLFAFLCVATKKQGSKMPRKEKVVNDAAGANKKEKVSVRKGISIGGICCNDQALTSCRFYQL